MEDEEELVTPSVRTPFSTAAPSQVTTLTSTGMSAGIATTTSFSTMVLALAVASSLVLGIVGTAMASAAQSSESKDVAALRSQIADLLTDQELLNERLVTLERADPSAYSPNCTCDVNQTTVDALTAALNTLLLDTIPALEAELNSVRMTAQDASESASNCTCIINGTDTTMQIQGLRDDLSTVESEITTIGTEITNIGTEITNIGTEITDIESDITTLGDDVTSLTSIVDGLQNARFATQAYVNSTFVSNAVYDLFLTSIDNTNFTIFQKLNVCCSAHQQNISGLASVDTTNYIQHGLDALTTELGLLEAELGLLETSVASLATNLTLVSGEFVNQTQYNFLLTLVTSELNQISLMNSTLYIVNNRTLATKTLVERIERFVGFGLDHLNLFVSACPVTGWVESAAIADTDFVVCECADGTDCPYA